MGANLESDSSDVPPPSRRSIHNAIESMIMTQWEALWVNSDEYRQTKYFVGIPSKVRAKLLLEIPREPLGRLIRFLTGHAFLGRHNAIVFHGLNPPPGDVSCRLCEDKYSDEKNIDYMLYNLCSEMEYDHRKFHGHVRRFKVE